MDVEVVLAVVAVGAVAAPLTRRVLRHRRSDRVRAALLLRLNSKLAEEDVTRFGEELVDLHVETMTTALDAAMRDDYQRALDAYESAKHALGELTAPDQVSGVTSLLADGRYAQACVLARRDDLSLPERRPPCFFDPAHGPATSEVRWAPPMGTEREIPVCFRDAERLAAGEAPQVRLVRLGNRRVPWYAAGPTYTPWASGWYARMVETGRVEAPQLTTMFALGATPGLGGAGPGGWSDPGGWSSTDLSIPDPGHDMGGWDGGGFDGGGFDGAGGGGGDGGGGP